MAINFLPHTLSNLKGHKIFIRTHHKSIMQFHFSLPVRRLCLMSICICMTSSTFSKFMEKLYIGVYLLNMSFNPGHIFELYNILVQVRFAKSRINHTKLVDELPDELPNDLRLAHPRLRN